LDLNGESFMGRRIVVELPKNESEMRDRRPQEKSFDNNQRENNSECSIVVKNLSFKLTE
jgi:hypothetical protein